MLTRCDCSNRWERNSEAGKLNLQLERPPTENEDEKQDEKKIEEEASDKSDKHVLIHHVSSPETKVFYSMCDVYSVTRSVNCWVFVCEALPCMLTFCDCSNRWERNSEAGKPNLQQLEPPLPTENEDEKQDEQKIEAEASDKSDKHVLIHRVVTRDQSLYSMCDVYSVTRSVNCWVFVCEALPCMLTCCDCSNRWERNSEAGKPNLQLEPPPTENEDEKQDENKIEEEASDKSDKHVLIHHVSSPETKVFYSMYDAFSETRTLNCWVFV